MKSESAGCRHSGWRQATTCEKAPPRRRADLAAGPGHGAALPALVGPPVEQRPPHQRRPQVSGRRGVRDDSETCRSRCGWPGGAAALKRGRAGGRQRRRRRSGKGVTVGPLEGAGPTPSRASAPAWPLRTWSGCRAAPTCRPRASLRSPRLLAARPEHQQVHLKPQPLLHPPVLPPAVHTDHRRGQAVRTTGPQALNVELREDAPRRGDIEAVRVGRRAREERPPSSVFEMIRMSTQLPTNSTSVVLSTPRLTCSRAFMLRSQPILQATRRDATPPI